MNVPIRFVEVETRPTLLATVTDGMLLTYDDDDDLGNTVAAGPEADATVGLLSDWSLPSSPPPPRAFGAACCELPP
jgi:hypothetical protein